MEAVKLSHRDHSKTLCICTDASDLFWAGVVPHCDADEMEKAIDKQSHEPLGFLGAAFTDSQMRWSTFERRICDFRSVPQNGLHDARRIGYSCIF